MSEDTTVLQRAAVEGADRRGVETPRAKETGEREVGGQVAYIRSKSRIQVTETFTAVISVTLRY